MNNKKFTHKALDLEENKSLVYTAMSKHLFYYKMFISAFVIKKHKVPLNPFMIFDYFMADMVEKDLVREANNNLVKRADELWVFGEVSNGVLAEVKIAKKMKKEIKYFKIEKPHRIVEIEVGQVKMEKDVEKFVDEL